MKYNQLGNSQLKVSQICLGTMTWGEQNSASEGHQQIDYALERGVNFLDTAEMYPVPPKKETYAQTEQIIGRWPGLKKHRDKIILASKIIGPGEMVSYVRGGDLKFSRENFIKALDASLKRLNCDYIDLYQIHWPDRPTNFFGRLGYQHKGPGPEVDILEILETFQHLKESGKVRYFGLSNETSWGAMKFITLAQHHNLPQVVSIQNPYNLLNRSFESGLSEICARENLSLLAYSPLAFGRLTGKYRFGKRPAKARLTLFESYQRYSSEHALAAQEEYFELAEKYQMTPTALALAFVNQQFFCDSNIIGATTLEQLEENIRSVEVTLSEEILAEVEKIHARYTYPCP